MTKCRRPVDNLFRRFRRNWPEPTPSFPLGNGLWPIRVLVAWLDGLVEILVSVEFTGSPQSFGAYIISQATGFLRYAAKL